MSNSDEIREFLTTRRAKITPQRAGLPTFGRHRRVSGLRREEVALVAGISVEYYTRLERGNAAGVSDDVLHAVCAALQLDDAERAHLLDLVRVANERTPRRASTPPRIRPGIARIVDAMTDVAAFVQNGRGDIVYANRLAAAIYSDLDSDPVRPPNTARYLFIDPRAKTFYADWEKVANETVAVLRGAAGRNPYDRGLSDLVGMLSTRNDEFRVRWASHDVRFHRSGTKRLRHPLVGDLTLNYELLDLPADTGLTLVTYSAEPGSPTAAALRELAAWSATRDKLNAVAGSADSASIQRGDVGGPR
jgi:transcriptional regulator with XRE-family HTH domain